MEMRIEKLAVYIGEPAKRLMSVLVPELGWDDVRRKWNMGKENEEMRKMREKS